jgi:hypothetical protein
MNDQQTDTISDQVKEIQRLKDQVEALQKADVLNFQQHKQILEAVDKVNMALNPIAETYRAVNLLGKWLMAFLVFISILFGVIANWGKIINIFFKK